MTARPERADAGPHAPVGVLVVDDLPAFRSAASAVIQGTPGFSLLGEAGSGDDAIDFVAQHAPDLVLLDVRMPKLDGVATARAIARIRSPTVTVLVSAEQHPEIAADPRAHGAAGFLPKEKLSPRTLKDLWAAIGGYVAQRGDDQRPRRP